MLSTVLACIKNPIRQAEITAQAASSPFSTHVCVTAKEIAEICLKSRPALALIDVSERPECLTQDIEALRKNLLDNRLPIIALTSPQTRLEALKAGADEAFNFDIEPKILFARMRNMVQKRNQLLEFLPQPTSNLYNLRGFAERRQRFQQPSRVLMVGDTKDMPTSLRTPEFENQVQIRHLSLQKIGMATDDNLEAIWLNGDGLNAEQLCHMVSFLRSRTVKTPKPIILALNDKYTDLAALSFDLGVEEVVSLAHPSEEITFRIEHCLLRWKQEVKNRQVIVQQLQHAVTDPLTRLANRHFALPQLELLSMQLRDTGLPYCVAIMDIDHFKAINDTHGHLVGDEVLAYIAQLIRKNLRSGDIVARFGGEEFLVLMPNTEIDAAAKVAQRICQTIESHPFPATTGPINVTISAGLCTGLAAPKRANADLPNLYRNADVALYHAKNSGRNCIKCF